MTGAKGTDFAPLGMELDMAIASDQGSLEVSVKIWSGLIYQSEFRRQSNDWIWAKGIESYLDETVELVHPLANFLGWHRM